LIFTVSPRRPLARRSTQVRRRRRQLLIAVIFVLLRNALSTSMLFELVRRFEQLR
jgi:hypothetical protein